MADPDTSPADPPRFETGDWDYDPKSDPEWDDPKIPRLRLRDEDYGPIADAIVRGQPLEIDGHEVVGERGTVRFCILDLRRLYEAVVAHTDARLARATEDAEGFLRPAGVVDQGGNNINRAPTRIVIRGCVIESCKFTGLDIACALESKSRFVEATEFIGARFASYTSFSASCFAAQASFYSARFTYDAMFDGARFQTTADYSDARIAFQAWFAGTRFDSDAGFNGARFAADAWFDGAEFSGGVGFIGARFMADAWFGGTRFAVDALFDGIRFDEVAHIAGVMHPDLTLTGDLRRLDVRETRFESPHFPWRNPERTRRLVKQQLERVTWTLVRSIGELSILTRLSILAIILVPPIASAWPAVRAGVVGYNSEVTDLSERFERAASSLRETGVLEDTESGGLGGMVGEIEGSLREWHDRFGRMSIDGQNLPASLALAFFAAAFVTLAQLIYQIRAPNLIRKQDEDGFVDWMHSRYAEGAKDRNDGLRRACDSLAAAAREHPMRNANLVMHHGEMVWIPPKERIDWFEDIEAMPEEGGPTEDGSGEPPEPDATKPPRDQRGKYPEGYLPAAERARIAIEEGAKAEYWMESRRHRKSAWVCAVFYGLGVVLLLGILIVQGRSVWRSAGFPWIW